MSWLIAVLSVWVLSAVVLLSTPRVVKVLRLRGLDGDDSGDALRATIAVTVTGQRLNTADT